MIGKHRSSFDNIFSLEGQVVLVTGAAGQLGSSIVNGLVDSNARVIAVDADENLLNKSSDNYNWDKKNVILSHGDITKRNDIINSIQKVTNSYGLNRFGC